MNNRLCVYLGKHEKNKKKIKFFLNNIQIDNNKIK